jgi:hypothetical protein
MSQDQIIVGFISLRKKLEAKEFVSSDYFKNLKEMKVFMKGSLTGLMVLGLRV